LLVVISIIALLIGILLPALASARDIARGARNLSNVRQIGIGMNAYATDRNLFFPYMSSDGGSSDTGMNTRKPRWVDYMFEYMPTTGVFKAPNIDFVANARMRNPFWHQVSDQPAESVVYSGIVYKSYVASEVELWGGYGLNFQYIGNSRKATYSGYKGNSVAGWNGRLEVDIVNPSKTILVGDTHGSRSGGAIPSDGKWWNSITSSDAVYVLDSPLGSFQYGSGGNGRPSGGAYYPNNTNNDFGSAWNAGGNINTYAVRTSDEDPDWNYRALPAMRNRGAVGVVWVDGHATNSKIEELDDSDGDGMVDNGNWNGRGDASVR
jgi:type II secretory pathway pseudopilin PulG